MLKQLKHNDHGFTHLKIEKYYNKGGHNYFSGVNEDRGYYIMITPVIVEDRGGYMTVKVGAYSGFKMLVQTTGRKNAKHEAINNNDHDMIKLMIVRMLNVYSLNLEDETQ